MTLICKCGWKGEESDLYLDIRYGFPCGQYCPQCDNEYPCFWDDYLDVWRDSGLEEEELEYKLNSRDRLLEKRLWGHEYKYIKRART